MRNGQKQSPDKRSTKNMCTASWHHHRGYSLYFNRDELRTRKIAEGPEIQCLDDVQVIAPRDGDFGGSWISVNEYGLSLALLNRYEDAFQGNEQAIRSRGLLLMDLAPVSNLAALRSMVREMSFACYRPFTLLALTPGHPATIMTWNGLECSLIENGDAEMPLVSSSYNTRDVIAARQLQYRNLFGTGQTADEDLLLDYHRSHHPQAGPYSTCMHREDAATVSFSRIEVSQDSIRFAYHPASPCSEAPGITRELRRVDRGQG